jgi:hypothetical protein
MIIRGVSFGIVGTGCFVDPLHPKLKELLQGGKYFKHPCPQCNAIL